MSRTGCWLIAAYLAFPASQQATSDPAGAFLAMGIRQVEEGHFDGAVFSLDSAVRKLGESSGRTKELVRAYVYMGVAYVGLDHDDAAKGKFREALKLDPELKLGAEEFPPRVIKVFESQRLERTAAARKSGARRFLIIGGVGAAAAVGVAAAASEPGAPPNRAPQVTLGHSPERAIAGVTSVTFQATGSDADGDAVAFSWDLADGTTASGATVRHVFRDQARFSVTVTATDGRGASSVARDQVIVRTLTDRWSTFVCLCGVEPYPQCISTTEDYQCQQTGSNLECRTIGSPRCLSGWRASLSDPFGADLRLFPLPQHARFFEPKECRAEVCSSLQCIRCGNTAFSRTGPDPLGDLDLGCQ